MRGEDLTNEEKAQRAAERLNRQAFSGVVLAAAFLFIMLFFVGRVG